MLAAIKSEFRKLLSIRSTYIITALAVLLVIFFAFYVEGLRANAAAGSNPGLLASETINAIGAVGTLGCLVGVLLLTHEYRYNTIMYTLTASRSRTNTFLAKIIVISIFSVIFSIVMAGLAPMLTWLGMHLHGVMLVPQSYPFADLLWRTAFSGWGFAMLGLLFSFLLRHQVGAIAALFLFPATVEPLLGLLLKGNAKYLPYNLLNAVNDNMNNMSHGHAALLFACYLLVGYLVAWQLFLRRDAN